MLGKFKNYRQIRDIESELNSKIGTLSAIDKRKLVPIAVIDDETFSAAQNLENNGYVIEIIGDLKSIDEITKYNIILCDLQGVGRLLNAKNQGAYIIDEIKRNHPEKFVIAYTGGASDDRITQLAQNSADFFLKKDADIEEWRDKLDEIISLLSNPIFVWKRQRFALIDSDVPTLDILKLEDAFVRAIESKSSFIYDNFVNDASISSDLRAIARSLVASGIFRIIVGS
jgi:CheY-like chemotaxis protein